MNAKNSRFSPGTRSLPRALASGVMLGAALLMATPVHAAFHLWNIREVYTDTNGSRQFIEFFTASSSQQFVGGQSITVSSGGTNHTFTIPSNLPGDTLNHAFLIGTASVTNFGAPTPNYIIPTNFIFSGGGSISFFGANSGAYTALPINGTNSRTWGDGDALNSPQNFAGQIGSITNPAATPPAVSITNPPNNSLFDAPATVPVSVSATDSDGSVVNVQLLTNGVAAATNTVAPFGFTLSNLAAGNYTLNARALDNAGLSATSAPISIRVANRPVLAFERGSSGPIQFRFNSATGINYVVDRAGILTNFSPIVTNPGSGGVLQFQETNSSATQRTYRVRLQ